MQHPTRSRPGRGVAAAAALACAAALAAAPPAAAATSATVFYKTGWATTNIHYQPSGGSWTTVPGVAMEVACAGWVKRTIDLGTAPGLTAVFNNGSGIWDNNGGGNYALPTGNVTVNAGVVGAGDPCGPVQPGNTATVYYASSWASPRLHYQPSGGSWTAAPGLLMDPACAGWAVKTLDIGTATSLKAAFNNGSGTWDNNGGTDYALPIGTTTIKNGVITPDAANPCTPDITAPTVPTGLAATVSGTRITLSWTAATDDVGVTGYTVRRVGPDGTVELPSTTTSYTDDGLAPETSYTYSVLARDAAGNVSAQSSGVTRTTGAAPQTNKADVYYFTKTRGWTAPRVHYQPTGGAWTATPGVLMDAACADWAVKTLDLGTATGLKAAFNNGSGVWDNNGGSDYTLGLGRTTVKDGVITAAAPDPCAAPVPDTQAPTVPSGLSGTADGTTVELAWTASTDNVGVTGYTVTQTRGGDTTVYATSSPFLSLPGLAPQTAYTYTVRAYDAAGNTSAASASVTVTTGEAAPEPEPGEMLGGDPRKDAIYFAMTARFMDGHAGNNRGGSQHVKSGNAAANDPMFRGDFKGLIDRLDYIKALGFSAIWITPVVLNRSDYDFHGYHGWDFYRVDPRLESPGASYQDLIDGAHAKGIKIYQDVVYNHSSRWGAKGLYVPKVWGARDGQWDWFYSAKQAGKTYDPLDEHQGNDPAMTAAQNAMAKGRPYNGDLWSTEVPAGNACPNYGVATGQSSPEGFALRHCQWPTPTSKLFPADLYHQCWIGNWEGEDARSCWLHEDLADFNTENPAVQQYLIDVHNRYIDMGVDGFRIDTAVHIPRVTWNRRFLPALEAKLVDKYGADKAKDFYVFGEVAAFVNDKWNRGSVNHSAQFFTWKERRTYTGDDVQAALDQFSYENTMGTGNQPTSSNAFLNGNAYHAPDHSQFSGMNIIDMRMHMNFGDASNAFHNGRDSDDATNDATFNAVYVDSHDYGPNKSNVRYTGGTDAWAENMALMWTFRGIPTLYYGSEIEFMKGARIDCGPTCPLSTTGRAYFGDHLAGSVTAADFGIASSASGQVATTLAQPLVKHLQRLNRIRRAVPALQMGQYSREGVSGDLAFKRRYTAGGVDSFVLVAISGSASFAGIPNGTYKDAVTGDVKVVTNGTLTAVPSGKGDLRAYVLDLPGANAAPGRIGTPGPYLG
ncbi:carbohydrate binding domain-containing protein [Actinocorallia sp. A-T 12471]|uniref:carbohydrate binding domain-containing protein n=1 Tax=Actinocorallia sp. A-T 12471 TaxID=3089813 RepID=UPI0029D2A330|nr:carbohydrate binding domain-containing protein [Actinocorallia sp. A-T 12471]MDX6739382.1 carbohydrate binding domain-containing protein [Actinocorallia sp. A-T 12471]